MKCIFISFVFMSFVFMSCNIFKIDYTYKYVHRQYVPRQPDQFAEMPKQILDNIDSLGVEESTTLNKYEVKYLELLFGDSLSDFNLKGKTVGFIKSRGLKTSNKVYFDKIKDGFYKIGTAVEAADLGCSLLILTEEQKKLSGGYDAVILYWSKRLISDKRLIKSLLREIDNPAYKD